MKLKDSEVRLNLGYSLRDVGRLKAYLKKFVYE